VVLLSDAGSTIDTPVGMTVFDVAPSPVPMPFVAVTVKL
jgi:hypothetical protein